MRPDEEERFISNMMHDANRRKIKLEKEQRMKFETEEREVTLVNLLRKILISPLDPRISKSKICFK